MSEGFGPLDLSGADLKGFDAVEPGRYIAEVFQATWDSVKNASGSGKMPAGTPMLKIQFKLNSTIDGTTEGIANRRVFAQYVIPPEGYEKAPQLKGMLARFLIALGYAEDQVTSKKFKMELDDLVGRPCVVTLGKEQKKDSSGSDVAGEFNNPVKGVKHIDTAGEAAAASSGIL